MKVSSIVLFVLSLQAALISIAQQVSTISVGSPVPIFKVSEWIVGAGVDELEKGKVHVVEFTTTGCGPCIKAIPHLSELRKKYEGKANVISVFAGEKNVQAIKKLVASYSNDIQYPVAIDMPDESMRINWMNASNRMGYPTVYIIDQEGTIAWIGNPLNKAMDSILEQVCMGVFDKYSYEKKEKAKLSSASLHRASLINAVNKKEAMAEVNYIEYLDSLIMEDPVYYIWKFQFLLPRNENAAYVIAREAYSKGAADSYLLADFYMALSYLKRPDFKIFQLILDSLYRSENNVRKPMHIANKALLFFMEEKFDSAVYYQERTVAEHRLHDKENSDAIAIMEKRLNWFRICRYTAQVKNNYMYFSSIDSISNGMEGSLNSNDPNLSIANYLSREYGKKGFKTFRSQPLSNLYKLAYLGEVNQQPDSYVNILYDIKDPKKLVQYFLQPKKYNKYYNYSLTFSNNRIGIDGMMDDMKRVLTLNFGFQAKMVDTIKPVWKLVVINKNVEKLRAKSRTAPTRSEFTKSKIQIKNLPVEGYLTSALINLNEVLFANEPLVNETGITHRINILLNWNKNNNEMDIESIRKELRRNGLDLKRGEKRMKGLLISDN